MSAPVLLLVLLVLLALSGTHAFFLPVPAVSSSMTSTTRLHSGIKGVETFDGAFTLSPESESVLFDFLQCDDMKNEVCKQAKCSGARFTGQLFQPVPYSPGTPIGMPREFEDFHLNPSYAICNVPPTVMFKAKIFKPPRLCAVFAIEGLDPEEKDKIMEKAKARMDLQALSAARLATERAKEGGKEGGKEESKLPFLKGQPVEEDWSKVGASLKELMSEEEREAAEEAALDAMVV
ncbi:hypothetical protein VYU27_004286 [Nannochloropsis oceanica]